MDIISVSYGENAQHPAERRTHTLKTEILIPPYILAAAQTGLIDPVIYSVYMAGIN